MIKRYWIEDNFINISKDLAKFYQINMNELSSDIDSREKPYCRSILPNLKVFLQDFYECRNYLNRSWK